MNTASNHMRSALRHEREAGVSYTVKRMPGHGSYCAVYFHAPRRELCRITKHLREIANSKAIQGQLETVAINICSATAQDTLHKRSSTQLMTICSATVVECRRNWLPEHAEHTSGDRGSTQNLKHAFQNASYYDPAF